MADPALTLLPVRDEVLVAVDDLETRPGEGQGRGLVRPLAQLVAVDGDSQLEAGEAVKGAAPPVARRGRSIRLYVAGKGTR